eukprot:COSAG02_NODE_17238_length_1019_cov_1.020652_2_plen_59_part_00
MSKYGINVVPRLDRADQGAVLGTARRDTAATEAELTSLARDVDARRLWNESGELAQKN